MKTEDSKICQENGCRNLRQVRIGISLSYFVTGLIFASWASRIPDIKFLFYLSDGDLGILLFAIPLGQILMMLISGYVVNKFGSRNILLIAMTLYAVALFLIALSNSFWTLFGVLSLFGVAANMVNIAVNTQACGLEALYRRTIMASFHGFWSLGGLFGGILGAVFAHVGYSITTHFAFIVVGSLIVTGAISRYLLSTDQTNINTDGKTKRSIVRFDLAIILLGLIGFGGMFCEGTMFDWSSVYFATIIRPDDSLIRLGYIVSMGAMTMGRFCSDKFITRYQAPLVLKFSGLSIAFGLLLATLFPFLITSTIGFLFVGLGVSSIVPICYSMAGKLKSMPASIAITMVSSISFLGFMIGPPLIGLLSKATDLRIALASSSLFGMLIIILVQKLQTIKINKYEN